MCQMNLYGPHHERYDRNVRHWIFRVNWAWDECVDECVRVFACMKREWEPKRRILNVSEADTIRNRISRCVERRWEGREENIVFVVVVDVLLDMASPDFRPDHGNPIGQSDDAYRLSLLQNRDTFLTEYSLSIKRKHSKFKNNILCLLDWWLILLFGSIYGNVYGHHHP